MATHDYVIANGTGAAVRSDLNNALAAIVSNNSGSSEPGTTYAYQWWADTNANALKIRNSSNDGWITLRELDGTMLIEDGSASTPGLAFADDVNTGIFSPAADQIGFATGGAERLEIGSSEVVFNDPSNDVDFRVESNGNTHMLFVDAGNDRIGINTSSPGTQLHVNGSTPTMRVSHGTTQIVELKADSSASILRTTTNHPLLFGTNDTERARFDSSGRLLLGTTTEGKSGADEFTVATSSNTGITIRSGTSSTGDIMFSDGTSGDDEFRGIVRYDHSNNSMQLWSNAVERLRIDDSGRIGIKNSSPGSQYFNDLVIGDGSGDHGITLHTSTTGSSAIAFSDATSGSGRYAGYLQYDHNDNSMKFYTNGGSEQARITSAGNFLVGQDNASFGTVGHILGPNGQAYHICSGDSPLLLNRQTNDGELVRFAQSDVTEGNITVSGSTVSYNGGHLSRYSQLASGAERSAILRGSVLSNLDEMCEWVHAAKDAVLYTEEDELPEGVSVGDVKTPAADAFTEDNEQLNRMKVSDVEGDVNVAGVFQGWDDDDDTYTNDFYCAMTGDFVIRIAQGTTVARGDLLMSAGDGTAKPQDDDIVRSKTIAKVTSTTVSTTYSDGSYCVPCVLMAC